MKEQSDSRYLTDCAECINNEDCPCAWSIGCSMCVLIQQRTEEK